VASIIGSGPSDKSVVLEMAVNGDIIAKGLCLSLVIGLLGGSIPSVCAMLRRPLQALV
jgi:hypothetical protein